MSEYDKASTGGPMGLNQLEAAFNRAVRKYFARQTGRRDDRVTFRVQEMYVIASHNPIHGYRVKLKAEN